MLILNAPVATRRSRKSSVNSLDDTEIRDQVFAVDKNKVMITVVCCDPEKLTDRICCKGGKAIQSIEIVENKPKQPEKPKEPEKPKPVEKPKEPEKPKVPVEKPKPEAKPPPVVVPVLVPVEKPKVDPPKPDERERERERDGWGRV
ncbi:hypothetical protein L2E82_03919 [Cichorium intybus]|uniref:Uncharacterized protein n=1 Tax=Cichorium intybus TaxID=13427 RepID=A0ACB9H5Q7_CICIN|nr:hypothetical protein L2E82_03919 [Cichorium intybus]